MYDKFIESVKELEVDFRIIQDRVFDYDREKPIAGFASMVQFFDKQEKKDLDDQINKLEKLAERTIKHFEIINPKEFGNQKDIIFIRNLYHDDFFRSNSFGVSHYGFFLDRFKSVLKQYLSVMEAYINDAEDEKEVDLFDSNEFKKSPFHKQIHYRAFLYLEHHSNITGKKKWTYIYNCLNDNYKLGISEGEYLRFVCDKYEIVSNRLQKTATNSVIIDSMNDLLQRFVTTL